MTPPPILGPRRRGGKDIPRLPLSAFSPPNTGTSDTFPLPPTPSLITPTGIVDAHLHLHLDTAGSFKADIAHLRPAHRRAVVLSSGEHPAEPIISSLQSVVDARVLSVLVPFALESSDVPHYLSATDTVIALTTTYNGATPVVAEAEEGTKDQPQLETPVKNLRWALQRSQVVDLDIAGGVIATDPSSYDSLVNLLTKAIKSETKTKRTPIVLTNLLPPPLATVTPVVAMMNHPIYTTYRQRVSLLSLFEDIYVKLLPPTWVLSESTARLEAKQEKEFKDILKLFIVPVLEAFGFERIIFGSSPASAGGSPVLAEIWYKLVLDSFRELAVSQDEMDKIFIDNAERVYGQV